MSSITRIISASLIFALAACSGASGPYGGGGGGGGNQNPPPPPSGTVNATAGLARVAGGHTGGWSAAISNTGTVSGSCTLNDSPNWATTSAAGTYVGSAWVKSTRTGTVTIRVREYNKATNALIGGTSKSYPLTSSWQLITASYTAQQPGASTIDFNLDGDAPAATVAYSADDI